MGTLVPLEGGTIPVAFPTFIALEGALACVDALVAQQFGTVAEALGTVRTGVWLAGGMSELVLGKLAGHREGTAAFPAGVGVFGGMDQLVSGEAGVPSECSPTVRALRDLVLC